MPNMMAPYPDANFRRRPGLAPLRAQQGAMGQDAAAGAGSPLFSGMIADLGNLRHLIFRVKQHAALTFHPSLAKVGPVKKCCKTVSAPRFSNSAKRPARFATIQQIKEQNRWPMLLW
ncbi:MAG: hypothetical protein ACOY32_01845 [Thermodesulfobacteriota bacterium]